MWQAASAVRYGGGRNPFASACTFEALDAVTVVRLTGSHAFGYSAEPSPVVTAALALAAPMPGTADRARVAHRTTAGMKCLSGLPRSRSGLGWSAVPALSRALCLKTQGKEGL